MREPQRCTWAGDDPDYRSYHDTEWGVAVHDDRKLFEMLILEGFQAGLSWITILKRRKNFRKAFCNWDWHCVASMTQGDADRLMLDEGIIRNRLKINAAITNARMFEAVRKEFGSFDSYIWQFTGNKTLRPDKAPQTWTDIPTHSAESDALSRDLKKRGFKFVGTVICYALMQAVGMVDDHMAGCFKSNFR